MMRSTFFLVLCLFLTASCQNGQINSAPIEAISASEYDFFTDSFTGDNLKPEFSLKLIKEKTFEEKYQGQTANYKMTASGIHRGDAARPASILIKMEMDRVQSSLSGPGKRKNEIKYFCLPSGASPTSTQSKYTKAIRSLGYKDFEVYTSFLSEVFSETYLK